MIGPLKVLWEKTSINNNTGNSVVESSRVEGVLGRLGRIGLPTGKLRGVHICGTTRIEDSARLLR
jgi:hypothetical protein